VEGSVEEGVVRLQNKKRDLMRDVLLDPEDDNNHDQGIDREGNILNPSNQLTISDLSSLFDDPTSSHHQPSHNSSNSY